MFSSFLVIQAAPLGAVFLFVSYQFVGFFSHVFFIWRCLKDSNLRITDLQSAPLGRSGKAPGVVGQEIIVDFYDGSHLENTKAPCISGL